MIPRLFYRFDWFNLAIVTLLTDFEKKVLMVLTAKIGFLLDNGSFTFLNLDEDDKINTKC